MTNKKIIVAILVLSLILINIGSALALTKTINPIIIDDPIISDPIIESKADITNINISTLRIVQAIANNYTKILFTVTNNNPDNITFNVRIQPGDGISDITYNNVILSSGEAITFNPKWIYTIVGTKNANIKIEYNSQIKDYPFQINVIAQNTFTISGKIIDANTSNGLNTLVYFGLDKTGSNPLFTLTSQLATKYLFVSPKGFYSYSQPITLNKNIEKNISSIIRFNTTVLGEDGLYFMKFMTNTFNPDSAGTILTKSSFVQLDTIETFETSIDPNQRDTDLAGLSETDLIYTKYLGKFPKASGTLTTWKTLPIKVYYNRTSAPVGYIGNLTNALNNWSNAAGKPGLFIESATPIPLSDKGINFFYPSACPNGGYGETYPVNSSVDGDITNVNICIRTNLGASTYRIFAHELGHGLALWSHSDDLTHLMKAGGGRDITTDEATLIRNLYNVPSLTNMDYYKTGYVNTYLKNILIYTHNTTYYNFTDRFYSAEYTEMFVCRDIACTNCNIYNKSNCVCYTENISPSPAVGTFITATCQYPKTSTDPLYTKVCNRNSNYCSKMCNLQALNC